MAHDKAYYDAKEKIEELRFSGEKLLSFNSLAYLILKLSELPDSIGTLKQLKTLNLTGHQLTNLPKSIGELAELETLSLGIIKLQVCQILLEI